MVGPPIRFVRSAIFRTGRSELLASSVQISSSALSDLTALAYAVLDFEGMVLEANRGFCILVEHSMPPPLPWNAADSFMAPEFTDLRTRAMSLQADGVASTSRSGR